MLSNCQNLPPIKKKIYEFERNIFLHSATDVSCKVSNGSAACSLYLASVK